MRDLRRRCPWDATQTPRTLRPYLVEEALELDHAVGEGDPHAIREELGDVLLHVAFQIVLAEEAGHFGAEDVTRSVELKMHRRHPHLFDLGSAPLSWERSKQPEQDQPLSVLDGLPPNLPPLIAALRLGERAAGVGFDWADAAGPLAKTREELLELQTEMETGADVARLEAELGDLLFAVVNLARKLGTDPRAALERANARFSERFRRVEALAAARGMDMHAAGLEALDRLWEEAKQTAKET
ncbi:MAG: nucleoside triphosphate pyrophosphohydrolase [Myxococcaceae bacterium]|nr:nucleoside triphosphate pyrophosphohydrolase [Myxococcaceae bacterium]